MSTPIPNAEVLSEKSVNLQRSHTDKTATPIMNNPFDYTPDEACREAFRHLTAWLEELRKNGDLKESAFLRELDAGKMLGVLIAEDDRGERHTLYAFSGQLGAGGFHHDGFVGPVFDYLQPDGYFRTHERDISRQNAVIAGFEKGAFAEVNQEYIHARERMEARLAEVRERCRLSRQGRQARRDSGLADEEEMAEMIRQSQFEKAELHRLKKRLEADLEPLAARVRDARTHLDALKEKRRADSEALQTWLFSHFQLLNARGETKSLREIFAETPMRIPPSGAGECCAPKLLHAAYLRRWRPVSMAEYWYGKSRDGEVRIHGEHYPSCRGKCLPVLGWMLRGLTVEPPLGSDSGPECARSPEILFDNQWFCVVDKPAGMLSVPGKGAAMSVQQWLSEKYGPDRQIRMVHRLDQDTSGLLIAAFGELPYKLLQKLFATRRVRKTYVAELEGDYESSGIPRNGRISLPLSPDPLDRPRQRVDEVGGKEAVTDYEFTGTTHTRSRVTFHPLTGRTHQLRVHAASHLGLGMPIAGDRLYGTSGTLHGSNAGAPTARLLLHAHRLEFTFPIDGLPYRFVSPLPF